MHLKPITSQEELAKVKLRLFELMSKMIDNQATEQEVHEREVWNILIDVYERQDQREVVPQTPAELIRHEMQRLGLNQSEFAQQLGLYQSHVSDIIRGKRTISKSTARALLQAGAIASDVLNCMLYDEHPTP